MSCSAAAGVTGLTLSTSCYAAGYGQGLLQGWWGQALLAMILYKICIHQHLATFNVVGLLYQVIDIGLELTKF
jgi:hypothetical protein